MRGAYEANVPFLWRSIRPFYAALSMTRASRFYTLRCLGAMPTERTEASMFFLWNREKTFERISKLIVDTPFEDLTRRQIGCHFCGCQPVRPEQTIRGDGESYCAACGSDEVTWTHGPHEEGCPYPEFACECGGRPSWAKHPPMRDAKLIVARLKQRGEWP